MMLRWLQKTGHKPITLMGGGTTKVGDPSFRSDERPLLSPGQIAANIATIRGVFAKYLDLRRRARATRSCSTTPSGSTGSTTSTFLRDIGRHFSVNRMLSFESVKSRLDREQPLSLPRVQLHDPAGLRLPRAPPPRGLPPADGRLGPVGQHRQRHRPHPPRRGGGGLRADLAAPHHLRRPQDGQVAGRRRLAQRRDARALRLLAVLAQHHRRRRRPLPQALHRASRRRMRPPRRPRRLRDQRREDHASPTR